MKGAREGVRVFVPLSTELVELLDRFVREFGLSGFSPLCRKDLARLLASPEAIRLLEARCALSRYGARLEHEENRAASLRLLHRRGVRLDKGKKPHPAMVALVEGLVPILLAHGVRFASGDNARMVLILRRIAAELDVSGDPRDELRRQVRIDRALRESTRRLAVEIIREALRP